jgi:hypothetical protein
MKVVVETEWGEVIEWDNEERDKPIVEINGKKYRDVTQEALESDTNVRPCGSTGYHETIDTNSRFRIGNHWKRSKRIMSRKMV